MLTKEQLSTFRSVLLKEKKDAEKELKQNDHFGIEAGHYHESMGELSSIDNHPADEGTALYEREKDIALNEHVEKGIQDTNKALEAIEQGTYGICEVCKKDIPIKRLEALPTTTYCIKHSPDQHISHQRPVEEGVLMPPYGKFSFDGEDSVGYDAEDSWQDVAKWGTSETPSDLAYPVDSYNEVYIDNGENVGYVEDFENFVGTDINGKNITVYPNNQHETYERYLDEEGTMTIFGDLPGYEKDPYTEEAAEERWD